VEAACTQAHASARKKLRTWRLVNQPVDSIMGGVLVAWQFGLLLLLAGLAAARVAQGSVSAAAIALALASVVLVAWTFWHNRPGNFNIRPMPRAGGRLITSGPYRHIRHPMYSAVLLGAGALALTAPPLPAWLAWAALLLVLLFKAQLEERWMAEHHPDYTAYCTRTRRLLPGLF
jgi:protein-S-isoprenylcysteine O-methyltransferase Ste14